MHCRPPLLIDHHTALDNLCVEAGRRFEPRNRVWDGHGKCVADHFGSRLLVARGESARAGSQDGL